MSKRFKKLSASQISTLSSLCSGAVFLVAAALVLSGTTTQPSLLAISTADHIVQGQAAAAFLGSSPYASFTTPGTYTWTVPSGVFTIVVTVIGGGGGAGGSGIFGDGCGGAGGGSGGYQTQQLSVTPGQQYTVVVGAGGAGGVFQMCLGAGPASVSGGSSSFSSAAVNITATGGIRGTWGSASGYGGGGAGGIPNGVKGGDTIWYSCGPGDGGTTGTPYGNGGSHDASCYTAGNPGTNGIVSISAASASVSLSANPAVVNINGTSTLTRAVSGVRPNSCTITDQSGNVILSNFGDDGSFGNIFLTSGTSFTVPSDWTSSNNFIEVIGGGGGGVGAWNSGGGGGGYAKALNVPLTPGSVITYAVGAGGTSPAFGRGNANPGGDSYICNTTANCASIAGTAVRVGAKGGGGGLEFGGGGGAGGMAAGGICAPGLTCTKYSGGPGAGNSDTAGGGGGAGGPHGNGGSGGTASGTNGAGTGGGGGGGGSNGDPIDSSKFGNTTNGTNGGNNWSGIGAGAGGDDSFSSKFFGRNTDGSVGVAGGGGGGGYGDRDAEAGAGGGGGDGTEWGAYGSGGGGGGAGYASGSSNELSGGNGGLYGGGGGGAAGGFAPGGTGGKGIIVLSYPMSPNRVVGPLATSKTYTLTCLTLKEGIPLSASANVTISTSSPTSTLSITATNNSGAPQSGTFTLNSDKTTVVAWSSAGANAASCTVKKYSSPTNATTTVSTGAASGTLNDGPFATGGMRRFTFACNDTTGNAMTPAMVTLNIDTSDICTDIAGNQPVVPPGCQTPVPNPGSCIPPGKIWDGTQCINPPITAGAITQDLTANPSRVRKSLTTSLSWATTGMTSCTLLQDGAVINNNAPLSSAGYTSPSINANTVFTLRCSDGTSSKQSSATVGVLPTFQEL